MSDNDLLEGLILLGAVLIAATTGVEIRPIDGPSERIRIGNYFPQLSVAAALVSGLALAQLGLIVVLARWPALARLLTGPVVSIYGLAWFQGALIESRLAAKDGLEETRKDLEDGGRGTASALIQIGLSAQMGLLLCAIGARRLPELALAAIVAFCSATTSITAPLQRVLGPFGPRAALRCLTGALLFALGVGAIIRQATANQASQGSATLVVAGVLWVVGLSVLLRLSGQRRVPPRWP